MTCLPLCAQTGPVRMTSTVTYTVVLANDGSANDKVMLTDMLPTEVTFGHWVEQPAGAMLDPAETEIT